VGAFTIVEDGVRGSAVLRRDDEGWVTWLGGVPEGSRCPRASVVGEFSICCSIPKANVGEFGREAGGGGTFLTGAIKVDFDGAKSLRGLDGC